MSAATQNRRVFPIGKVSELTGVNSVTLRAWERRYGLITPTRTSSGHRLYSEADVELIGYVVKQLERGIPVSGVARQLRDLNQEAEQGGDNWSSLKERMAREIRHFDERALDAIFTEALSLFPAQTVVERLLAPLLADTQTARERNDEGGAAEANFYNVFVRNKLGARFHHCGHTDDASTIIATCLPGQTDDLALLIFGLTAKTRGYNPIILGGHTPLHEIPVVLSRTHAHAVVLAGSRLGRCAETAMQIAGLTRKVKVPVFIGGIASRTCMRTVQESGGVPLGPDLDVGMKIIRNTLSAQPSETKPMESQ